MLLEAPLFKKKQANSCLSLSLDRPCGNKHKFCKIPPQKKDFRENLTSWDASNVIRSTTVEERKAITHLSLMIEKKEQEAITHVSLSLSLLIGLAETNINFAKFRLRRKIFEKTSQAGTTFASNVIRSTTVEERKAITHLSLMIEKKEQEAITHVSLSLSLSLSVDTQASPRKSTQPAGQRTKRMHGCKPLLIK